MNNNMRVLCVFFVVLLMPLPRWSWAGDLESSIGSLATKLSGQLKNRNIQKIAVSGFTDLNGYQSALGDLVSEELITNLFIVGEGGFDVVERRELERILSEQELAASGLFDPETIAQIGKVLGIQALVTGSISRLGEDVKINARAIGVENARIVAAAAVKVEKEPIVDQLMGQRSIVGKTFSTKGAPKQEGFAIQSADVFYKNSFLRIIPTSVILTSDEESVQIAVDIINTTNSLLYLAYDSRKKVTAMSDSGDKFSRPKVTGLERINNAANIKKPERYTVIDINSRAKTILEFPVKYNKGIKQVKGQTFSFSVSLLRLTDSGPVNFSAGLSGIELR